MRSFRIALLTGDQLAVRPAVSGYSLFTATTPVSSRPAPVIEAWLNRSFGPCRVLTVEPRTTSRGTTWLVIAVAFDRVGAKHGALSRPMSSLTPQSFSEPIDRELFEDVRAYCDGEERLPAHLRRDGLPHLLEWVDAALRDQGAKCQRRVTNSVATLRAFGHRAVLRIETSTRPVFLKIDTRGFCEEPGLTRALAALAPRNIPHLLASDDERGWWLLDEVEGSELGACLTPVNVIRAIRQLIDIQARAAESSADVLRSGIPVLMRGALIDTMDEALQATGANDRAEVVRNLAATYDRVAGDDESSWVHPDLSAGNIFIDADTGRVTFLDLSRSYWGPMRLAIESVVSGLSVHGPRLVMPPAVMRCIYERCGGSTRSYTQEMNTSAAALFACIAALHRYESLTAERSGLVVEPSAVLALLRRRYAALACERARQLSASRHAQAAYR
jgi:hypothetical protein